eukprot:scaffold22388_cov16-Tisochrysis_lutea.AAC.1
MEVFLKPGPNGTILHQPVSLIGNMPLAPAAVEARSGTNKHRPVSLIANIPLAPASVEGEFGRWAPQ